MERGRAPAARSALLLASSSSRLLMCAEAARASSAPHSFRELSLFSSSPPDELADIRWMSSPTDELASATGTSFSSLAASGLSKRERQNVTNGEPENAVLERYELRPPPQQYLRAPLPLIASV